MEIDLPILLLYLAKNFKILFIPSVQVFRYLNDNIFAIITKKNNEFSNFIKISVYCNDIVNKVIMPQLILKYSLIHDIKCKLFNNNIKEIKKKD